MSETKSVSRYFVNFLFRKKTVEYALLQGRGCSSVAFFPHCCISSCSFTFFYAYMRMLLIHGCVLTLVDFRYYFLCVNIFVPHFTCSNQCNTEGGMINILMLLLPLCLIIIIPRDLSTDFI